MRFISMRILAFLLRVERGTLYLLEMLRRTDVIDVGIRGTLERMRTWFLLMVFKMIRRRSSSWPLDIEIGAFMPPPDRHSNALDVI
jgi:hypothetical protein